MTSSPPVMATSEEKERADQQIIDSIGTTYDYGWHDSDAAGEAAERGLNEDVVRSISAQKGEPEWMLKRRLKALKVFDRKPMPTWGPDLSALEMDSFKYFVRSTDKVSDSWEALPEEIRNTYDRLGIPEAERNRLVAGVAAQYESEVVYNQINEELARQGVIFLDTDTALKEHPELFQEYFGRAVPAGDNKFAALNTAVWSGGSFIYVPKGVHVEIPLQAYFRINTENMGQFERTLIICDEDSYVHYVEGCTAPIYSTDSLHAAIVEIFVNKGARCRYTTVQNWSNNVYNLVTQRAVCAEGATMEWIDGNIGSKMNMKYPSVYLTGPHARGEALSIAFAGEGQHQDTGAKMVHMAPRTSSSIVSKSISRNGGRSSYRGLVQVNEEARHSKSSVVCDALLVDQISRTDTYPYVDVRTDDVEMGHEATVSKVSEDQLFYLMSRGMTETEAMAMIVRGFVEPIARELPMEYALELNRLIELQMEGSVG
ncbi:MAG: Fe-S cluster assembly protein SufB [Actinomycetaceae bacterium]|nr:Fe-S cluster assembly protein SufB [Actinomycetaceae bacterium]